MSLVANIRQKRGARRGSSPITKAPPKGSKLERYVNHLIALYDATKPFYKWSEEDTKSLFPQSRDADVNYATTALREISFASLCKEEPRLWMLPRQHVRDILVIPAIKKIDGNGAADGLTGTATLDEFTNLICENAYRNSTARERLAPKKDISRWVILCTLAAMFDCGPCEKPNQRHEKAAKILGVNRCFTRRTEKYFLANCSRSGTTTAEAAALVYSVVLQLRTFEHGRRLGETIVQ
ncbi:hypothetical protein [Ochrobactrum sp. S1502_03]|uniref:hypothetical protein n=1 Tax=Ochrobactrum sp. S1502_03 TaxID=3108451 RepID=UPI0037CA37EE